jgi:hypothetical protein
MGLPIGFNAKEPLPELPCSPKFYQTLRLAGVLIHPPHEFRSCSGTRRRKPTREVQSQPFSAFNTRRAGVVAAWL